MVFIHLGRHSLVDNVIRDQIHYAGFHHGHWYVFCLFLSYEHVMRFMRIIWGFVFKERSRSTVSSNTLTTKQGAQVIGNTLLMCTQFKMKVTCLIVGFDKALLEFICQ